MTLKLAGSRSRSSVPYGANLFIFEVWSYCVTCLCVSLDEDLQEEFVGQNVTCNDACFGQLFDKLASDKLSSKERVEHCNSLHSIGGSLMYSTLCRNILSDIPEHRAVADKGGSSYRKSSCNIIDIGQIQK